MKDPGIEAAHIAFGYRLRDSISGDLYLSLEYVHRVINTELRKIKDGYPKED